MAKPKHNIALMAFTAEETEALISDSLKALGHLNVRNISVLEKSGRMKAAVTFTHGKAANTVILDVEAVTASVAGHIFADHYQQWIADRRRAASYKESMHSYNVDKSMFSLSVGG